MKHSMSTRSLLMRALLPAGLVSAMSAGTAHGQQAYFSFEGDFPTNAGDQHNFTFNLAANQASTPGMFFRTYSGSGGTNLAGDTIAIGLIDPFLNLFTGAGVFVTFDDDSFGLDSQIDFTGNTDGGALPDPLTAGDYRLNHATFGNDDAGPWALDLAGPAGNFTLTGASPIGSSTVSSLKFGTIDTGMGIDPATFNQSGPLDITGPLVVAQTGNAVLTHAAAATTTVGGQTTVNAGGTLNITGNGLRANGGLTLDGGTLNFTPVGFFDTVIPAGQTLTATNSAVFNSTAHFNVNNNQTLAVNGGADVTTTNQLDVGSGSGGTLNLDGSGSSASFSHGFWGLFGGTATVNVRGGANVTTAGTLYLASFGNNATSNVSVETGGTMNVGTLLVAADNAGNTGNNATLTVTGTGSAVTQGGASALTIGGAGTNTGTVNVNHSGDFNTGTGTTTINKTGTLNIQTNGELFANGPVNVIGGTVHTIGDGEFTGLQLGTGQTLTASEEGQITFVDAYRINNNETFNITDGSDLVAQQAIQIGHGSTGMLTLDGDGTTMMATSGGLESFFVGSIGGTGTFNVRNDAAGTIVNGLLRIADSINNGSNGTVNVESGGDLTINNLSMTRFDLATAVLNVTGTGSTLTQTGASTANIGSAGTSSATVSVADSGVFNTGTGLTTIGANGQVNLTTGGTFNANGDITVDGGSLNEAAGASFNLASGKTLSGINNGQIDTTGTWFLSSSRTISLASGADHRHAGGTLVAGAANGPGTITLTGVGTSLDVDSLLLLAQTSGVGNVTVDLGAMLSASELRLNENGTAAGNATFQILGGSTATIDSTIRIGVLNGGEDYDGTGLLRVSGAGSSLTQTAGSLLIGNSDPGNDGGDHQLTVENSGVFTTATGTTTIRKTGTLNVNTAGVFNANGDINIDAGTLNVADGSLNLAAGKTLTASNQAQVNWDHASILQLTDGLAINVNTGADLSFQDRLRIGGGSSAQITVDGSGSTISNTNVVDVGHDGGTGTLTLRNQAHGDFDSLFGVGNGFVAGVSGTLNVESGATMTSGSMFIGDQTVSNGVVNVTGAGSSISLNQFANLNIGNPSTGSGTLNIADGGTFTTGAGASVNIRSTGTIKIDGGTFIPAGTVTFNGGTFHKVVAGPADPHITAGSGLTINPGSTLIVEVDPGYTPTVNDTITLFNTPNSSLPPFDNFVGQGLGGGFYFEQVVGPSGLGTMLQLVVNQTFTADLDFDGDVDDADFGIAFAAFTGPNNGPSSNPLADLDMDGDVDDADFGIAFAAFTGPGGVPANVPEPTSLALFALGGLIAYRRRRMG